MKVGLEMVALRKKMAKIDCSIKRINCESGKAFLLESKNTYLVGNEHHRSPLYNQKIEVGLKKAQRG